MKRMITAVTLAVAMMLVAAPASAGGQSAGTLDNAGWTCFTAGPSDWTHCVPPSNGSGSAQATTVKVFSTDGNTFIGTEILLSAAVYAGQPCVTDDGNPYHDLSEVGAGPYACHHFDTGH